MSWALGYDQTWQRDIGYGVIAYCDHPGCTQQIDRGLGYVCAEGQPYGGDHGCGLYFCEDHRGCPEAGADDEVRCGHQGFTASPDHPRWIQHKLTHPSWSDWRAANPAEVQRLEAV